MKTFQFHLHSHHLLTGILLLILLLHLSTALSEQITPYNDFSDDGVDFYGHGRELDEPKNLTAVYIGLMGPNNTPAGKQLQNGVAFAIEEANAKGAYRGIPYKVIFRSDDGPWGIAAKQVVRLTYEDRVWVIIGALEGHQAHLAELISAKAWIPIITPGAIDRSIDYANVPWIFRCMPDDSRQASALLRCVRDRGYKHLVVLTAAQREAYTGFLRLKEVANRERYPIARHMEYVSHNPTAIIPRLHNIAMDALLIWGNPKSVLPLLRGLRRANINVPVFLPSLLATPEIFQKSETLGNIIVAAPFDLSRDDAPILTFRQKYQQRTKGLPSPIAFFAYDATRMVITAIERAGLNRARIRDELARLSFDGITGKIHFDSLGGNPAEPILMTVQNKQWVRLKKRENEKSPQVNPPSQPLRKGEENETKLMD